MTSAVPLVPGTILGTVDLPIFTGRGNGGNREAMLTGLRDMSPIDQSGL